MFACMSAFLRKIKKDLLSCLDHNDITNHYNKLSYFSDKAGENKSEILISNMITISITSISITIGRKHFLISIHEHTALAFMAYISSGTSSAWNLLGGDLVASAQWRWEQDKTSSRLISVVGHSISTSRFAGINLWKSSKNMT